MKKSFVEQGVYSPKTKGSEKVSLCYWYGNLRSLLYWQILAEIHHQVLTLFTFSPLLLDWESISIKSAKQSDKLWYLQCNVSTTDLGRWWAELWWGRGEARCGGVAELSIIQSAVALWLPPDLVLN